MTGWRSTDAAMDRIIKDVHASDEDFVVAKLAKQMKETTLITQRVNRDLTAKYAHVSWKYLDT